mmetsp:Transcript_79539/g.224940  ORF Transcript_79539/g.224940 Transcript_79539/m.224940 type:complete len:214 (+) Transcript_79539:181-822(+)
MGQRNLPSSLAHLAQEILELQDLLQEDFGVRAVSPLGIDVDHITVQVELHLAAKRVLALQRRALHVHALVGLVHHAHELVPQALLIHFAKLCQLRGLDGRVELHVRTDTWQKLLLLDFLQEEVHLPLVGLVRVEVLGVVEVWQRCRDELGAGIGEKLFKAELLPALQPCLLVAMLVATGLLKGLVESSRTQRHADEQQGIHLILLLHHLVILV